jgi:GDP-L-fucose synthase
VGEQAPSFSCEVVELNSKIFVAGASGLVGSAIIRALAAAGHVNIIGSYHSRRPPAAFSAPQSGLVRLDLTVQAEVREFLARERPEYVILAAAKVGGIHANNTYPAEFIHQNLAIQTNVIHESWRAGVKRLLFLGSSCIYPRDCPQPMKEEHLLTGPLEPTNRPYALAKIAGIEMCWAYNRQYGTRYLAAMPTNLYGPGDNFDLENSHVIPAMLRKFHLARLAMEGNLDAIIEDQQVHGPISPAVREMIGLDPLAPITPSSVLMPRSSVTVWGTGTPRREFLYCQDMADGCVHLMKLPEEKYRSLITSQTAPLVNIGSGVEVTIGELAEKVKSVVGYQGRIEFDAAKPDGTPRKLLDVTRMAGLGWQAQVNLAEGLRITYDWFRTER